MIFYAYFGYPILLWVIYLFASEPEPENRKGDLPRVSLLISAYNEEEAIKDKILNSLAIDYPRGQLEIVVVSDGSDDRTDEIANQYRDRGVLLRRYEGRIGKTACLNQAVPLSKGDFIVFSDANSRFKPKAIRELIGGFSHNKVGFVTGVTLYVQNVADRIPIAIGLYSKLEKLTKGLESRIGSCVGADGTIFAIRKHLYQPLRELDINDFVIPLNVVKQGYLGKLQDEAVCVEKTAKDSKDEYGRQVRITNRTIRAIFNHTDLFNPFKYGFFSIQLLSHKLTKFLVPFFMISLLVTNVLLVTAGYFYVFSLAGQGVFYASALLKNNEKRKNGLWRLTSLSHTFLMVNMAVLWGWVKYGQGETYTSWSPSRG